MSKIPNEKKLKTLRVDVEGKESTELVFTATPRASRKPTPLRIASRERDLEALSPVISEWLVPLLVKEFLAEYQVSLGETEVSFNKRATGLQVKEGASLSRVPIL